MSRRKHTLLYVAGAGVAAWAAYEYLYKPWAAARGIGAGEGDQLNPLTLSPSYYPGAGGGAGGGYVPASPGLPALSDMVSAPGLALPSPVGFTSLGPQYSGVLGACIAKKGGTWSPEKCQQRLNDLVTAARTARAQIDALRGGSANPNAAGIAAAQLALAQNQAALNQAAANLNAATAAGDQADANTWRAAIAAHQADINDLAARIAAAGRPVDNSAAIAAYEGALAGNDNDYFNLTGTHLIGGI
jgi:hypothetical protein